MSSAEAGQVGDRCALSSTLLAPPLLPQVRELLKRKRFQLALELVEQCGQEGAAARGSQGGPEAAASAAAAGTWVGEALAQAGLLLLLDLQFQEAVQVGQALLWSLQGSIGCEPNGAGNVTQRA